MVQRAAWMSALILLCIRLLLVIVSNLIKSTQKSRN
jgi:hypothetical protein